MSFINQIPTNKFFVPIVQMLSAQYVAVYQGISTREVYLIENGKYRFVETASKTVDVCLNCFDIDSLPLEVKKEK